MPSELARVNVLVDAAKDALSAIEGETEIRLQVRDTMSAAQIAEMREVGGMRAQDCGPGGGIGDGDGAVCCGCGEGWWWGCGEWRLRAE